MKLFEFPQKGEVVPLEKIKEICEYYGREMLDLWKKIEADPPINDFSSDGCSCWPDKWLKKVNLYPACFKHDLKYWAGYPGEDKARLIADAELMIDVIAPDRCDGPVYLGRMMFEGVQIGGRESLKMSFSWGFGRT